MRCVFGMWSNVRMVVLVALSGAMYAAAILVLRTPPPLSTQWIDQLLPMPLSLLFGPAAAWGMALGAILAGIALGDYSGLISGPIGCFIAGALPFLLWSRLWPVSWGRQVRLNSLRAWFLFTLLAVVSAMGGSLVIAWLMDVLRLVPFRFLALLIGLGNIVSGTVSLALLLVVYRRVEAFGLVWWEIMDEQDLDHPRSVLSVAGAWLAVVVCVSSWTFAIALPHHARFIAGGGVIGIVLSLALMW